MNSMQYPVVEVRLDKIYENAKTIVELCIKSGIKTTGVVKGCNGLAEVAFQLERAGCTQIACSRLAHLINLKKKGIKIPLMLFRIPMMCEIETMIEYVDYSLNSELETIKAIEHFCKKHSKNHSVILMLDLGDLREGIYDDSELVDLAEYIENNLENVNLAGIGTNLGCYGSIKPTKYNLGKLCDVAEKIQIRIGRKLDIISGGATTSVPLLLNGEMPVGINNLRIGEGILNNQVLPYRWNVNVPNLHQGTFILKAQVIEVQNKPSYPIGEIFMDGFGNTPTYIDKGIRKRAIVAIGKQDFAYDQFIFPLKKGLEVLGSSSDHTILDIEECTEEIKVGDMLEFDIYYETMLFLTLAPTVKIVFI